MTFSQISKIKGPKKKPILIPANSTSILLQKCCGEFNQGKTIKLSPHSQQLHFGGNNQTIPKDHYNMQNPNFIIENPLFVMKIENCYIVKIYA